MTPIINEKFRRLIPPLAPEELAQLEANIVADGCRDPLVTWSGMLLDGHNRFDICHRRGLRFTTKEITLEDEDSAEVWIIRNQFGRRNLAPFTRVELALKLEPLLRKQAKEQQVRKPSSVSQNSVKQKPADTQKALAKVAGVSHDTIAKGKLVAEHADEATKTKLRENQISVHRVAKDIKEKLERDGRQTKRAAASKGAVCDSRIIVGDFRKNADKVADGSLSLIFTDPPYDREAAKMFPALAEFAAAKLADGGSLVMYLGHLQLPAAFAAFDGKLRHWWTCACLHSGDKALMREYGVRVCWKPMLWFVKGTRDDKSTIVFDAVTGDKAKEFHDWQQHESDAAYYIENLCPKDGIVCDPFLGGGTTASAAIKLQRQWIGFEIDPPTAAIASKRISA